MGAYYTGRAGSLFVDNVRVAKVRDWSIETSVDLLDTTALGDYARTYHPSNKSATGSATLLYYRLDSSENAAYKEFTSMLRMIMKQGRIRKTDLVTMKLRVGDGDEDATPTDNTIEFQAYITNASIAVTNSELTSVAFQFTVQGDFMGVIQSTF